MTAGFSHRWRDLGFMFAYIAFNIAAVFVGFYLYSVFDGPSEFLKLLYWARYRQLTPGVVREYRLSRKKTHPTSKNPSQDNKVTDQQTTQQVGGAFSAPA